MLDHVAPPLDDREIRLRRSLSRWLLALLLCPVLAHGEPAPAGPLWDLSAVYADRAAWQHDRERLRDSLVPAFRQQCEGRLDAGTERIADCLARYEQILKTLYRLQGYAMLRADEDLRQAKALGLKQSAELLATEVASAVSFLEPELQALEPQRLEAPALERFDHFLDDILRRAPHTLDRDGERLLAMAALLGETPSNVYGVLANADMPWPQITLSDGQTLQLDQAGYAKARSSAVRADRKRVFDAFWGTWQDYRQTFGTTLFAQLARDRFYARARGYDSSLAAALDADAVPAAVYRTLVEQANAHLPTLHRYFRLRGRLLGIADLAYHDIYPPLVSTDRRYPLAEAQRLTLAATEPLGPDYQAVLRRGFAEGWMDPYPRPGKRSGAYMLGMIYDVHPFVLMNYNEDYESVSTLAHEWGHVVHSALANASQPFLHADYATFTAEIASIFNEMLLTREMVAQAKDDQERLYYLGMMLESMRGTFYRQTMFAEFELAIHEQVDAGESLTAEDFTRHYQTLLRRYHGSDAGVVSIDPTYAVEWAYIPHFYYNFYVYQYATSMAAAAALAEQVLQGGEAAREEYLDLLRAGGSDYPYELLRDTGVDLASPAPYEALVAYMNEVMDQIETLLARSESGQAE